MKPAYYSEHDPFAAQWLRNLINAGHIPVGDVDERDIRAVQPDDLAGYGQRHLFAGVGGWAYACRLAGFPDDADILTGSPPCQPFSVAGRLAGTSDDRHLWPEMARLAASLRPAAVAVENVANIVGMALDGMLADLAGCGYAARAFVVPACAVDAPHRRDRLWIAARHVADTERIGRERGQGAAPGHDHDGPDAGRLQGDGGAVGGGQDDGGGGGPVADADQPGPQGRRLHAERSGKRVAGTDGVDGRCGALADADSAGRQPGQPAAATVGYRSAAVAAGGFWDGAGWIAGRDGKARRVPQSGVRLLASGVPARVGRLRAYGNAICPQVAAEVLKAMMEHRP